MKNKQYMALGLAIFFVFMAWSSTWFQITANGVYSEGIDREPTIRTEYMIDNNQESIEISIDNATPLLIYWLEREDIVTNQDDDNSDNNSNPTKNGDTSSKQCNGSCLNLARQIVGLTMFLFIILFSFSVLKPKKILIKSVLISWVIGTILVISAVPLSGAIDFGIIDLDREDSPSSTGGFDSNTQDSVSSNQFAHFVDSNDFQLKFNGILLSYDSAGYDLGLLNEEDRQDAIDTPPEKDDENYESYIKFHGELNISLGQIIFWWLMLLPLIFITNPKKINNEIEN